MSDMRKPLVYLLAPQEIDVFRMKAICNLQREKLHPLISKLRQQPLEVEITACEKKWKILTISQRLNPTTLVVGRFLFDPQVQKYSIPIKDSFRVIQNMAVESAAG